MGRKQKLLVSFGNQEFAVSCFSTKWCHQESNRGHKDFQSFALPTELWHHRFLLVCGAKVGLVFEMTKHSCEKMMFGAKKVADCSLMFAFCVRFNRNVYLCARQTASLWDVEGFRIVAQLVAYHVRDVGVGSSSLLYPTTKQRQAISASLFCL